MLHARTFHACHKLLHARYAHTHRRAHNFIRPVKCQNNKIIIKDEKKNKQYFTNKQNRNYDIIRN